MNPKPALLLLAFAAAVLLAPPGIAQESQPWGVYEYVVEQVQLPLPEASEALSDAIRDAGYELLCTVDEQSPDDCAYHARVFVCVDSAYVAKLLAANPLTGPFAATDRIVLFQDERGLQASIVNPCSIDRTVLLDDPQYAPLAETHRLALREIVSGALPGTPSDKEYGPIREKGYIDKTMKVVAGGPFDGKIEELAKTPGADPAAVATRISAEFATPGKKWGTREVFRLDLPEAGMVILGLTGDKIESKSFEIVKSGGDEGRKDFACPGIDHAGAYPMEMVIRAEGGETLVQMVDIMFRMKMYFEDAGNWAFMKNRGMPGSIKNEIKDRLKDALKS